MEKEEKKTRERRGGQQWGGGSKENMEGKERHLERGGEKREKIKRREREKKN